MMPSTEPLDRLTGFVRDTRWDMLPPDVQERARMVTLDTLGAMLGGGRTGAAGVARVLALESLRGDEATLASGGSASILGAAFANAVAANAIDIDDCSAYTWGHPGAQVVPAALALAESDGRSVADLLAAIVVGYEVAFLAGRCMFADVPPDGDRGGGYRGCGSWGAVACAAAASHLLRLDPPAVLGSLGIAEYHAPYVPILDAVDVPAMVKHGTGVGAMTGIMSAQLATRGFTGTPTMFGRERFAPWVSAVGSPYLMTSVVQWKEWACCAWVHPALSAVRQLMSEHVFNTTAIERVVVECYGDAVRLGSRLPTTTEDAQFNMAWPIAALLSDGEVMPDQILQERLRDASLRSLASAVTLVEAEDLNELYYLIERMDTRGADAARVTIELADGRSLSSGTVRLDRYAGWSHAKMEAKFRRLAEPVVGEDVATEVIATVWDADAEASLILSSSRS